MSLRANKQSLGQSSFLGRNIPTARDLAWGSLMVRNIDPFREIVLVHDNPQLTGEKSQCQNC